jgi:hypothetical protein
MRLIHPGLGDCADRLSILARKIEEGRARGILTTHWEEEEQEIRDYMQGDPSGWLHLAAVNAMIWDLQAVAGMLTDGGDLERPNLVKELTRLNRRRVELVEALNGDAQEGKEKI